MSDIWDVICGIDDGTATLDDLPAKRKKTRDKKKRGSVTIRRKKKTAPVGLVRPRSTNFTSRPADLRVEFEDKARLDAAYVAINQTVFDTLVHDKVIPSAVWINAIDELLGLDGKILVIESLETVAVLRDAYGVNPKRVAFWTEEDTDAKKSRVARKLGCQVTNGSLLSTFKENNVKFDVILGNPPFSSDDDQYLAETFFKLALETADTVAMVLPSTHNKGRKAHNDLVREHGSAVIHLDRKVTNGEMKVDQNMWIVICDHSGRTLPDDTFAISSVPRNTIPWTKGKGSMSNHKKTYGHWGLEVKTPECDVTIYHKINGTKLFTKYGTRDQFKDRAFFPSSGYALLLPQTFHDRGWNNYEIVECDGSQVAWHGMNIVFFPEREQLERLLEVMSRPEFIEWGKRTRQGHNEMVSGGLASIPLSKEDEDYIING